MNKIHEAYGGGEILGNSPELISGEISGGCLQKWYKPGIVVACIGKPGDYAYAYDPEFRIVCDGVGDPATTHVVWDAKLAENGSGWRHLNVVIPFSFQHDRNELTRAKV